MSTSTRFLLPFLLVAIAAGGCKNSNDDGAGGAGGADGAGGDVASSAGGSDGGSAPANCYEPTPASGEDGYVATPAARTHTFEITLPDDPEGGLVRVAITGRQIISTVSVKGATDGSFMNIDGDAPEEGGTFTGTFVGAPGVTYLVDVDDSYANEEHDSPVELTWELDPTRDCFEPNDTPASAASIALDEDVVAFPFAGYTTNDWPSYEDHDDYYAVEIAAAGTLTVTLEPGPDALALTVSSADAPDASLADTYSLDESMVEVEIEVEPGTYLVLIEPFVSPIYNSFDGEPTQWERPYTLRAAVE